MSTPTSPDVSRGTVPDKLLVVMRPSEMLEQTIDGAEYSTKAKPTFFTDADGKTDKAIEWGTKSVPTGKRVKVEYGRLPLKNGEKQFYWADEHRDIPPKTKTIPNKPFTNIRLWTIDTRMEGGRAYKFIDLEGRYFDMREDTFLEAVFNNEVHTISGMVMLTGQYIWVRAHSQMRVCRVGSMMHQGLLEAKRRKNLKKITGKMQVVGGVYRTKANELYVFAGRYRSTYDKKLHWAYVQLREPYVWNDRDKEQTAPRDEWRAMTLQEKFDHERIHRAASGCAETRTTAMAVIEHAGTVDLGEDTVDTLLWHETKMVNGKVVRV